MVYLTELEKFGLKRSLVNPLMMEQYHRVNFNQTTRLLGFGRTSKQIASEEGFTGSTQWNRSLKFQIPWRFFITSPVGNASTKPIDVIVMFKFRSSCTTSMEKIGISSEWWNCPSCSFRVWACWWGTRCNNSMAVGRPIDPTGIIAPLFGRTIPANKATRHKRWWGIVDATWFQVPKRSFLPTVRTNKSNRRF